MFPPRTYESTMTMMMTRVISAHLIFGVLVMEMELGGQRHLQQRQQHARNESDEEAERDARVDHVNKEHCHPESVIYGSRVDIQRDGAYHAHHQQQGHVAQHPLHGELHVEAEQEKLQNGEQDDDNAQEDASQGARMPRPVGECDKDAAEDNADKVHH